MCFCTVQCGRKSRIVANKGYKTLRKECFTNICPNTSFFYWLIMLWIFLIVVSIGVYGVLLVEVQTFNDTETSEMIMNLVIHFVNGLFTFAAVLNLPVRLRRLFKIYKKRADIRRSRKLSVHLFPSGSPTFENQTTEAWEEESRLIFDRLAWTTQHIILQALLWNSLFQIINQVFRCVYYSYELADKHPGNIFVNIFFPLAILASVVASMIQAVAENRFREKHSLGKKPNNIKKTLVEFWHNLWKVQTEAQIALAQQFDNRSPRLIRNAFFHLKQREVDMDDEINEEIDIHDSISYEDKEVELHIDPSEAREKQTVIYPRISIETEIPVDWKLTNNQENIKKDTVNDKVPGVEIECERKKSNVTTEELDIVRIVLEQ